MKMEQNLSHFLVFVGKMKTKLIKFRMQKLAKISLYGPPSPYLPAVGSVHHLAASICCRFACTVLYS